MSDVVKTGLTSDTPQQILFGACTVHKGLKYTKDAGWNYKETIAGATKGGSKLSIVPEIVRPEIDNVHVHVKQLTKKAGEKVTFEINFAVATKEIIKAASLAIDGVSEDDAFEMLTSSSDITEGAFWENIALVGLTLDGKPVIAIADNMLCTNGFENDGKSKEASVIKCTFESHADIAAESFDKLSWRVYYPKAA